MICLCVEWLMPVQSGEITNILLLLQGQHQCVLVALAKTVSQFTHNCTHIHPAPAHRVSYLHSLVLPCEAGTNFTCTGLVCIMYLPLDVCIYIMYIYQMQAMYNTCCFPSPSATQPSPHPPFLSPPGRPQADGFPLMCRGSA